MTASSLDFQKSKINALLGHPRTVFFFIFYSAILAFIFFYNNFLVDQYRFQGFLDVEMSLYFNFILLISILFAVLLMPTFARRPSDYFIITYISLGLFGSIAAWPITGLIHFSDLGLFLTIGFAPIVSIIVLRPCLLQILHRLVFPRFSATFIKSQTIYVIIAALSIACMIFLFDNGSTSFSGIYERRIDAREKLMSLKLLGYFLNTSSNTFLPILAFLAASRRSVMAGVVVVFGCFILFYYLGLKSVVVISSALFLFGILFYEKKMKLFSYVLVMLVFFTVISTGLLAQIGIVAPLDSLVRRVFVVQAQLQSYYFDYWKSGGYNGLFGAPPERNFSDITFEIGYIYINSTLNNANTNAFFYSLAKGGLPSYIVAILVITLYLVVLDIAYSRTKAKEIVSIAIVTGFLLIEQSWSTAMLSSGLAASAAVAILFQAKKRNEYEVSFYYVDIFKFLKIIAQRKLQFFFLFSVFLSLIQFLSFVRIELKESDELVNTRVLFEDPKTANKFSSIISKHYKNVSCLKKPSPIVTLIFPKSEETLVLKNLLNYGASYVIVSNQYTSFDSEKQQKGSKNIIINVLVSLILSTLITARRKESALCLKK